MYSFLEMLVIFKYDSLRLQRVKCLIYIKKENERRKDMPRKKSQKLETTLNSLGSDSHAKLLNELLRLIKNYTTTPQKRERKRRHTREPRVGFNLLIPYNLYVQLKNYVELYANRGESMTEVILAGLEKELKERYARKVLPEEAQTCLESKTN